jgi:perosamine synthetase
LKAADQMRVLFPPERRGRYRGRSRLRWPRRQPPVYSPITNRALLEATVAALRLRADPRPALVARLRAAYHADHATLCGSGTQALQIALRLAQARAGGEPIAALPAFTCFDVAAAVVGVQSRIMLYDVEPETLLPDLDDVRQVLRRGARVLVVASLFGYSPDWDLLSALAAEHGAVLIEDAAQGHGSHWRGRPLGSFASASILSFGRGKGWTGGGGGALLLREDLAPTSSPRSAGLAAELRILLTAAAQRSLSSPRLYALPAAIPWLGLGETRYRPATPPVGMTRGAAAVIMSSHQAAEEEATARRHAGARWQKDIRLGRAVLPVRPQSGADPGYLRYPLRISGGVSRFSGTDEALHLGIAPVYPSSLSAIAEVRDRLERHRPSWPGAEELAETLVTLPTHSHISPVDRARLLRLVNAHPVAV